jgi:ubiquinone/menaquinone biosynthesis C-methylase UbiE
MAGVIQWLDKKLYPDYSDNWDDQRLREAVLGRLRQNMVVLDLGAGTGRVTQMNFRGWAQRVVGIDPDPCVRDNPLLDEACQGVADRLPFPDGSFDLVFCDNVLEHLADPEAVLREVNRVLKLGGVFLAKTPNRTHYMTLIARLTPTVFHRYVNRLRGRPEADTFPTLYRMNSPSAIRYYARRSGFQVVSIEVLEGRPEYLRFNALTYLAGWLYERVVNSTEVLALFRIVLLFELRKGLPS